MDFFTRIAEHTPQLNRSDNEILSYCVRHHEQVARLKVTELADKLFISPASVIRFCKKLGFSGFAEFKASLRMELGETPGTQKQDSRPTDFFRDIQKTIQMVSEETVERILELIHTKRRIEIYAVGSSRMPAAELAKRFQIIGKAAFCYDDSTLMNISARQLTENDLVLALSISGETSLVISAANMAKSKGAALVSFTNLGSNTLSSIADENLYVTSTNFIKADLEVLSRVQLLIICEYLFFRYIENYGNESAASAP